MPATLALPAALVAATTTTTSTATVASAMSSITAALPGAVNASLSSLGRAMAAAVRQRLPTTTAGGGAVRSHLDMPARTPSVAAIVLSNFLPSVSGVGVPSRAGSGIDGSSDADNNNSDDATNAIDIDGGGGDLVAPTFATFSPPSIESLVASSAEDLSNFRDVTFDIFADDDDNLFGSPLAFDSSELGLWNGRFVPPPPRPPFFVDEPVLSDGLTTCDLCSWAMPTKSTFIFEGTIEKASELGWPLTLIIVSILSALVGAIIMVTVVRCRRKKASNNRNGKCSQQQAAAAAGKQQPDIPFPSSTEHHHPHSHAHNAHSYHQQQLQQQQQHQYQQYRHYNHYHNHAHHQQQQQQPASPCDRHHHPPTAPSPSAAPQRPFEFQLGPQRSPAPLPLPLALHGHAPLSAHHYLQQTRHPPASLSSARRVAPEAEPQYEYALDSFSSTSTLAIDSYAESLPLRGEDERRDKQQHHQPLQHPLQLRAVGGATGAMAGPEAVTLVNPNLNNGSTPKALPRRINMSTRPLPPHPAVATAGEAGGEGACQDEAASEEAAPTPATTTGVVAVVVTAHSYQPA